MKPWKHDTRPLLSARWDGAAGEGVNGKVGRAMGKKLKAPFPYFGGKSSVSSLVWDRLGDVDNYIEPFCGSAAMLLGRTTPPRIETLNDADCFVANFWRATQHDPEAVACYADAPVNEADLHARHRWLVGVPSSPWTDTPYLHAMAGEDRLETDRREFRRRMRTDPDYYCTRTAGWWCWGLCCWIGSGWCTAPAVDWDKIPYVGGTGGGLGVTSKTVANGPAGGSGERHPMVSGGQQGHGVHAKGENSAEWNQIPALNRGSSAGGVHQGPDQGHGVHAKGKLPEKMPAISPNLQGISGRGVHMEGGHGSGPDDTHRPQLVDAYSLGRGVNAGPLTYDKVPFVRNDGGRMGIHGGNREYLGTCAQRRAWLLDWFNRLRDRLRCVRVCCGSWERVCSSESVTTRLGITGVFLDPPYGTLAGRDSKIYSVDSLTVAEDVREWCLANGDNKQMRIALCGYAGEGHEALEERGWQVVEWRASGGYGNRSAKGKANAKKERIWFSPHCKNECTLFDGLEESDLFLGKE